RFREALVDDDEARPRPELPATRLGEVRERRVAHEEQRVAERLYPRLEAVGRRERTVVPDGLAALEHRALAALRPEHEARLQDLREDEHGLGLLAQGLRGRVHRIEGFERGVGLRR